VMAILLNGHFFSKLLEANRKTRRLNLCSMLVNRGLAPNYVYSHLSHNLIDFYIHSPLSLLLLSTNLVIVLFKNYLVVFVLKTISFHDMGLSSRICFTFPCNYFKICLLILYYDNKSLTNICGLSS